MNAAQYALPLSLPAVFDEGNFYVSDCNRAAHATVMRWPNWSAETMLLTGEYGSGKSHLGHIWAAKSSASIYQNPSTPLAPDAMPGNWLIEDIEHLRDERALLHLVNYSREKGNFLLLTSALPPAQLPFKLPDLTSRLLALPAVGIGAPDEEALAAIMRKQFADRQLKVSDEAIAFLLPRMERSFAKVGDLVVTLDNLALSQKREITIPFLKKLLSC